MDISSILAILDAHADRAPERLLFLWNLFEGVPKFYRDACEQGVLAADRQTLLAGLFFRSSSPLRTEAALWFLSELRGRYDVVLKFVARHPGCTNADIESHVREVSPSTAEHAGGYLKVLIDRYRMVERRLPVFAKPDARRGRYYLCDNFLRSWLAALHSPVSAVNFRPESMLVAQADERLAQAEGQGLEADGCFAEAESLTDSRIRSEHGSGTACVPRSNGWRRDSASCRGSPAHRPPRPCERRRGTRGHGDAD